MLQKNQLKQLLLKLKRINVIKKQEILVISCFNRIFFSIKNNKGEEMREVEKLETALQKRVEELNVEDLAKISLNEKGSFVSASITLSKEASISCL